MTTYNTSSTLSALWKEIYNDDASSVIPEAAVLQQKVKYVSGDKELGDKFIVPTMLSHEAGFSYLGVNSGASTLNSVEAAVYKEAQVDGSMVVLRSAISYNAAQKMANNKRAFMKWSEMLYSNMVGSLAKRLEIAFLYGQSGLGTVSSNGCSVAITLTTASWASGIWAGSEGSLLDCWASNLTTQRNTNAVLVVSSVDLVNRIVTVTGNASDLAAIAANDVFFFRGANAGSSTYNECAGLDKIITNTGTLFNISASTYALWKGNSYSASSAALTMAKVLAGAALANERGLEEDAILLCSPKTFANLNSDLSALRVYDSSYSKSEGSNGFKSLKYYHQGGQLEVISHIYCKEGEAFLIPQGQFIRVGSCEPTFKLPGQSEDVFLQVPDTAAYEIRCMSEQAIFGYKPAQCVKFTSIVNS